MAAAIVTTERIAVLIGRCAIYEQLYLTGDVPLNAQEATENLRRRLLTLYTAILQALSQLIRVFKGRAPNYLSLYSSIVHEYMNTCVLLKLIMFTRKIDR